MSRNSFALESQLNTDQRIDDLEERLKQKVEVISGFADTEVKARKLEQCFKFFDADNAGNLNYELFFAAMTKFNYIGIQREIEALYNRYDWNLMSKLDYHDFCLSLYSLDGYPVLDNKSKLLFDRMKVNILSRHGVKGIHRLLLSVNQMICDGGAVNRNELESLFTDVFSGCGVRNSDITILFNQLDDGGGKVLLIPFVRILKGGVCFERKQIIREAYMRICGLEGRGAEQGLTLEVLLNSMDAPRIFTELGCQGSYSSYDEAQECMVAYFSQAAEISEGRVPWPAFADYFIGLSACVADDEQFEVSLRNSWRSAARQRSTVAFRASGRGDAFMGGIRSRRVVATFDDGHEEVVELEDVQVGRPFDASEVKQRLLESGMRGVTHVRI